MEYLKFFKFWILIRDYVRLERWKMVEGDIIAQVFIFFKERG